MKRFQCPQRRQYILDLKKVHYYLRHQNHLRHLRHYFLAMDLRMQCYQYRLEIPMGLEIHHLHQIHLYLRR